MDLGNRASYHRSGGVKTTEKNSSNKLKSQKDKKRGVWRPKCFWQKVKKMKSKKVEVEKQSCRMSIFLDGAKPSSKILPKEKRVNRDNFGTKIDKGVTFGEQMLIILLNYESFARHFT